MKTGHMPAIPILLFLLVSCGGEPDRTHKDRGVESKTSSWMTFTATAYSVEGETATGKPTVEGRTVAADPAVLPFGTRIEVEDAGPYSGTYVVHDAGRKISGREIDIFIDAPAEAKAFGKKQVRVRIVDTVRKKTKGRTVEHSNHNLLLAWSVANTK